MIIRIAALSIFLGLFPAAFAEKKVVVLGFDGADHQIVEEMMAAGQLPNLTRLKEIGSYAPLMPTNPPQTPVSWSTFATGLNPGRTGIFDFIKRQSGTYTPDFALRGETTRQLMLGTRNRVFFPAAAFLIVAGLLFLFLRKRTNSLKLGAPLVFGGLALYGVYFVFANWIPESVPAAYMVRQGKPMWTILEEQGKTAAVIRLPVTFPAQPLNGEMVAGLAVPDIRGTVGKPSIFTNDPEWQPSDNQFSIEIARLEGAGPYETQLLGPPNKLFYNAQDAEKARLEGLDYDQPRDFHKPFQLRVADGKVIAAIDGTEYAFEPKQWSPWIEFKYRVNPVITLRGAGRFYLDYLNGDRFKLYLTPVHLHPSNPLPLSWPPDLAQKVWDKEPYKTMGWALDTWSIGNGLMDEDHFLTDVKNTVDRYEAMMEDFLADNDRDLFIQVFSFTDRVAHVLWRYWDEGHPLYDPEKGPKYQEAIRDSYRRMDELVGKAMNMVDLNEVVFLVCSDHGFSSWRHQFSYNTWLVKNGYMKLKRNVLGESMVLDDLENRSTPLDYVDWSQTKAYAMGLGMIFINLEGREPEGSVKPEEYDALCRQLREDLTAFVDEKTGLKPIREVYLRDDIYNRYDEEVTPDLRAATAKDYRVSWETTLGGMPADLTEPNLRNWSGDHCSNDPRDVRGILFSSVPMNTDAPHMADLCPSILHVLGVSHDIDMDGKPLFDP
ncbi:MAG: alkaline phosphatase family protein [Acidobacteriota bacterium]|nr:alkaline phosphatase family protein [Acidobacteriota bacterium]